MKTINLLVLILVSAFIKPVFAGDAEGHGGDGYASEFILTGKTAIELARKLDPSGISPVNIDTFAGVVLNTRVHSEDRLFLEGNEVDAINYPQKKTIKINRRRWDTLRSGTQTIPRFNLVIHEYLGIMNIDDSQYKISNKFIQAISPSNFSTDQWWYPMNPTNELTPHMQLPGMGCSSGSWSLKFDTNVNDETKSQELICGGIKRKLVATKSYNYGSSTSGIKGTFHIFRVEIFDGNGISLGSISYTPEWGKCLIYSDKMCSQSGTLLIDNVLFNFWMVRNTK